MRKIKQSKYNKIKKANIIILALTICLLQSCCLLFNTDCDSCKEVQAGLELADLLLQDFESELVTNEDNDTTLYNIIHTVVNFASEFECPETVSEADMHTDQLNLVYSETEDFTNPIIVETKNAEINQFTMANDNYKVLSNIQFETAGFYILDNTIDILNDVNERNETNNNDICALVASTCNKSKSRNTKDYSLTNMIHITNDMVSKNNKSEDNFKYISKWDISIE